MITTAEKPLATINPLPVGALLPEFSFVSPTMATRKHNDGFTDLKREPQLRFT